MSDLQWMAVGVRPTMAYSYYWCLRDNGRLRERVFIVRTEESNYLYLDGESFSPWADDRFAGPIAPPSAASQSTPRPPA